MKVNDIIAELEKLEKEIANSPPLSSKEQALINILGKAIAERAIGDEDLGILYKRVKRKK